MPRAKSRFYEFYKIVEIDRSSWKVLDEEPKKNVSEQTKNEKTVVFYKIGRKCSSLEGLWGACGNEFLFDVAL